MASPNVQELLHELAKQKERANQAEQQLLEEREHANRERARANQAEAQQAPTTFEHYLNLVQQRLVLPLSIESNPLNSASGSVTAVNEKYYPLEICRWDDFEEQHDEIFKQFTTLFSNKPLFPSETDVLGVQRELSPTTRKDEQDIRPFIRSAIEKPAERIVVAYYRQTNRQDKFYFQNNAYSLEYRSPEKGDDREAASRKKRSPERKERQPIPDRWGICEEEGTIRRLFVGEYKSAGKVSDKTITFVLTTASNNLFLEVLRRKQSGTANSEKERIRELVAQILCQAFHYMIRSGLLFGYVTSGQTLILLKIDENVPSKLHFHFIPVDLSSGQGSQFEAQYAPASQLATFVLLALREREMPRD